MSYERIDDAGLHLGTSEGPRVLDVDSIVVCAGQEPESALGEQLRVRGFPVVVVGGARLAVELDAVRAIREGTEAAARL